MEERQAAAVAEAWRGGSGLVPRGPKMVLGVRPADPADVQQHTGRRPGVGSKVWRVEVGGRFLRSGGLVYPGGVPFPEDLQQETAVVSSEVWLYVDEETSGVIGVYSWPEAVRKPVAARPVEDFPPDSLVHPADVAGRFPFELPLPSHPEWEPALVADEGEGAFVLCVREMLPDPVNEMLLYDDGGLGLRIRPEPDPPGVSAILAPHQPPFRPVRIGPQTACGREPGRALGPQTWPWPGELLWWADGLAFELKGFVPLATLVEVAKTVRPS